jgi:hypothetical protein
MRKLEHSLERRVVESPGLSRRDFIKAGSLGLAAFSCGGAALLLPKPAYAQVLEIHGTRVVTERISDTVANLTTRSRSYQQGERRENGVYTNGVTIRSERTASSVTLRDQREDPQTMGVSYPRERESGIWGTEINEFCAMIRRVTGNDLRRMRLIVDRTTDPERNDPIISYYAIPINSNGDITSAHRGGYLAVGASYYPDRGVVYGAKVLLLEPGTPEPETVARR